MLRNHSNFLGIEGINCGKATRFFSCGKNISQRTPTKDLNPVCHMPYDLKYTFVEHFYYLCYETAEKNLQQTPKPEKNISFDIYLTFPKSLWTPCVSSSRNCLLVSERCLAKLTSSLQAAYFEFKNQGTTYKTEKLTGFPSDQDR